MKTKHEKCNIIFGCITLTFQLFIIGIALVNIFENLPFNSFIEIFLSVIIIHFIVFLSFDILYSTLDFYFLSED